MNEWEFYSTQTYNGIFNFPDCIQCEYKFVVLAEKEINNYTIIQIYGYGNTTEEAMKDAKKKVNKL